MKKYFVLGLDIGTNSIGWSLIEFTGKSNKPSIVDMGTRIFDPGAIIEEKTGNITSINLKRREARLARRHYDRRRRRKIKLSNILKRSGLLPDEESNEEFCRRIDREFYLRFKEKIAKPRQFAHTIPYYMRFFALDHKIEPHHLGRVLYHLAQRRGFLSSRKTPAKEDEGIVKNGISSLDSEIKNSGSRTLGEYFSKLDPEQLRIRSRYTSRQMYIDEFEKIWDAQVSYGNSILSNQLKEQIFEAIFFQRKLKSVKNLIGTCALEPGEKRCPWFRFEAQRFRILQNVNNLRLINKETGELTKLNNKQRKILYDFLETKERVSVTQAKKALGLKPRSYVFSIEEGGEKYLRGNSSNATLKKVLEERWGKMTDQEKEKLLEELHFYEKSDALARRAEKFWKLDKEKAQELTELKLESGYCNLSRKAIRKIFPKMEEGISYPEAVKEIYGEFKIRKQVNEALPPVDADEHLKNLRNPVVHRCLTELRHCLNPIIRKYGKPYIIRIELARDIKQNRKERERRIKKNRSNEQSRENAFKKIMEKTGIEKPGREDILKFLLVEECNWICPYTQKTIGWNGLFGTHPEFDIEHIIPFSISLDDSYMNKTLCFHDENVKVKRNRTPYEAYGHDPDKYEIILECVSRFRGNAAREKLRRFKLQNTEEFEDFTQRHMNDTRYATREAVNYLALLYGGISDDKGKLRIQAVKGPITGIMRNYLGLNRILGAEVKNRDDHRHHAIDSFVVAYINPGTIRMISDHAKRYEKVYRVPFKAREQWQEEIVEEVRNKINSIIPFHRSYRRLRGPLHEETFYRKGVEKGTVHLRKALSDISAKDIENIVDNSIRKRVRDKLSELDLKDPAKAFSKEENFPVIVTRKGERRLIKKVRIEKNLKVRDIAEGDRKRLIVGGNNHHMEIVAILDEEGRETKWEGHVVSLFAACRRKKEGEPVVRKNFGKGKKFKFSICPGDMVEMEIKKGVKEIFVVRTVPHSRQLAFSKATDARKKTDIQAANEWYTKLPNPLKETKCRKVFLTPFAEIRYAND